MQENAYNCKVRQVFAVGQQAKSKYPLYPPKALLSGFVLLVNHNDGALFCVVGEICASPVYSVLEKGLVYLEVHLTVHQKQWYFFIWVLAFAGLAPRNRGGYCHNSLLFRCFQYSFLSTGPAC